MTEMIFGGKEMAHWYAILPDYVRAHLADDFREGAERYAALSVQLATAKVEDAYKIVLAEADLFRSMGRTRRIRFLNWASKRSMPDRPSAWNRLFEKSDDGEEGAGANDVVDLFVDDIRAMNPPLAAAMAARLGDSANVRIVAMAAQEIVHAPLPTGGMP